MNKIEIVVDRSRDGTAASCMRQYYWNYVSYNGGIVRKGTPIYYAVGEAMHVGIQSSVSGLSWSDTKTKIIEVFERESTLTDELLPILAVQRQEQIDLAIALVYVWRRERMPYFMQEYTPFMINGEPLIEQEVVVPIYEDDRYVVKLMSRMDIIVKRRTDDAVLVWELKSAATVNDRWIRQWSHNLQLLLQTYSTQYFLSQLGLKNPVVGIVIDAMVKGIRKRDKEGIKTQYNDLIYAYTNNSDGFVVQKQFQPEWKKNWKRTLVGQEFPGGIEHWIDSLPLETVLEHVRTVPPIMVNEEDTQRVLVQVGCKAIRRYEATKELNEITEEGLSLHASPEEINKYVYAIDKLFPQNFQTCDDMDGCAYRDCCFVHNIGEAPLESGLYQKREPNHLYELH